MKKIQSFFTKTYVKYFLLGLALSFVISFSLKEVMAGGVTKKFIQHEATLQNRIGSLSIGHKGTAPWINPKNFHSQDGIEARAECTTTYKGQDKDELEACLDVDGIGAFSKLMVLNIPAFFSHTLYLNEDADANTISSIPEGLVIEDFSGTHDDSIMVSGLGRYNNGIFAPQDTTTLRELCATPGTGKLIPCPEAPHTYVCKDIPDYSEVCSNDEETGLTQDTQSTLINGTCTSQKCEYICSSGYIYDASTSPAHCEPASCTGATPTHSHLCENDNLNLNSSSNLAKNLVDTCSTPTGSDPKCEYTCDSGYHLENGECKEDVQVINGQCGTANGENYLNTPPTSDLCSAGNASSVTTTTTTYTWVCSGINGGGDENCLAHKKINGQCDNSVRNGCSAGIPNDGAVADTTGYYKWRCDGLNGGSNSGTCQKEKMGDCFVHMEYDGVVDSNSSVWNYLTNDAKQAILDDNVDFTISASDESDCKSKVASQCDGFPSYDNPVSDDVSGSCDAFDQGDYEFHFDFGSFTPPSN